MANKHAPPYQIDKWFTTRTQTPQTHTFWTWPQFIVIEFTDESAAKPSPFAIDKGIHGIAGTVIKVNIMKSGNFLV
jgi:hypothetical protein